MAIGEAANRKLAKKPITFLLVSFLTILKRKTLVKLTSKTINILALKIAMPKRKGPPVNNCQIPI